ncbi:MAG: FAD-dependent oxidoreductase [Flavobacteriaceae bacterium]|nr:FAD-dependent oxidoreductase [Flavobacteriaceae bacterium]
MSGLSYWERTYGDHFFDILIVGAGIVGLNAALSCRERYPGARIGVLDKGMLSVGASTKNAGFACFGSPSELLEDLKNHTESEVVALVAKRYQGILALRAKLKDEQIDFEPNGSYEVFQSTQKSEFQACAEKIDYLNRLLCPVFEQDVFELKPLYFGMQSVLSEGIFHRLEGQLNPVKMMLGLKQLSLAKQIEIVSNYEVKTFGLQDEQVEVKGSKTLYCSQLLIATNGFSSSLLSERAIDILPARAQVLITKPIKGLSLKGTFHLDKGYYYFRNIDNRILLGGGRNCDFGTETTDRLELNIKIQNRLDQLLTELFGLSEEDVEYRWAGIMGTGRQKTPIVASLNKNIHYGIRLGGMGVALGTELGADLAQCVNL